MIKELLAHENYLRILLALRKNKGLRFTAIQKTVGLHPQETNRALEFLEKGFLIIPRAVPTKGERIFAEYELTKRGERFLKEVLAPLCASAAKLGPAEAREFAALRP